MRVVLAAIAAALMTAIAPAAAQVSADYYLEDGSRRVSSVSEVMYDDFFHSATFAIVATASADGLVTFMLEVKLDEGALRVSRGDSLMMTLRGGDRIVLTTARGLDRADVEKRHFPTGNVYYTTCRYPLPIQAIQRITRNRVTKVTVQTDEFTFDRKVEKFQDRFRRQFTAVYRHLMADGTP